MIPNKRNSGFGGETTGAGKSIAIDALGLCLGDRAGINVVRPNSKKAELSYRVIKELDNYFLLEIDLKTGRHHQIRAQLSSIGCTIKGDLKYGAKRSNKDGSIHLHARKIEFTHPVSKELIKINAPTPKESIWDACL